MADTLSNQTIKTVSSVDASQFTMQPGAQIPGTRVDYLNGTGFESLNITSTDGTYSANEFDPTVSNGIATLGRIPAIITTEQRMMGGRAVQNIPADQLQILGSDTNLTKAQKRQKSSITKLGWGVDSNGSPFLQDSFGRPRNPFPAIILHINPSEVNITQGIRGAESKNKSGTVLYTWRDQKRKTFFDEPVVQLTFHTGNILPFTYIGQIASGGNQVQESDYQIQPIPRGLANFYRFLELIDDRKILPDGRPNFVYITHSSRKFPKLTLIGFFNPEGIQIPDTAEDPNQLTWQASFTCRFTSPHLSDSKELLQIYQNEKVTRP